MLNKKALFTALLSSTLAFSASAAQTKDNATPAFVNEYLGEIAQNNKDIASSFATLIKDAPKETAWLSSYGTASPGVLVNVNEKDYVAFSGCEPKNCPNSGYAVLLDPTTNQFVKGAVRYESDEKVSPHQTTVIWLGDYDYDFVPALWQQFYLAN